MAKAQNFESILDKPASEIERPKPLPQGTYVCTVKGLPRFDKSSKKQTPFVEFTLQPIEAGEDVDEDDLKAIGGFKNKTIRATYYETEDAIWRLKKFIEDCGIEIDDGVSLRQLLEETPGKQVAAFIKHQASDDGQAVYAQLASTAPVE